MREVGPFLNFSEAEALFNEDDPRAAEALEPHARARNAVAARLLGRCLQEARPALACAWYNIAAELGDVDASTRLARCAGPLLSEQRATYHREHATLRGQLFEGLPVLPEEEFSADGPSVEEYSEWGRLQFLKHSKDVSKADLHLTEHTLLDTEGFRAPLPAMRLMLPDGWSFDGEVRWVEEYEAPANMLQWSFTCREDASSLRFCKYPRFLWQQRAMNSAEYLEQRLLPQVLTEVGEMQIVERVQMPGLAKAIQSNAASASEIEVHVDASRLRVTYAISEQRYEEWYFATLQRLESPALMQTAYCIERLHSFRAPAGELDAYESLVSTLIASVRLELRWEAAVGRIVRSMKQAKTKDPAERARFAEEALEEISRIPKDKWQLQREGSDRRHLRVCQALVGVESWADPSSGKVFSLSVGSKSAWRSPIGEVMSSQDPNFDASALFEGSWTRLRRLD